MIVHINQMAKVQELDSVGSFPARATIQTDEDDLSVRQEMILKNSR